MDFICCIFGRIHVFIIDTAYYIKALFFVRVFYEIGQPFGIAYHNAFIFSGRSRYQFDIGFFNLRASLLIACALWLYRRQVGRLFEVLCSHL